jgi:hypothetical protein
MASVFLGENLLDDFLRGRRVLETRLWIVDLCVFDRARFRDILRKQKREMECKLVYSHNYSYDERGIMERSPPRLIVWRYGPLIKILYISQVQ